MTLPIDKLAAIRAVPDDDVPRLAWARALRDRGATYGELIEIQCAQERCGTASAA
jgi:uncharacterized protein (TIGR02996 family)